MNKIESWPSCPGPQKIEWAWSPENRVTAVELNLPWKPGMNKSGEARSSQQNNIHGSSHWGIWRTARERNVHCSSFAEAVWYENTNNLHQTGQLFGNRDEQIIYWQFGNRDEQIIGTRDKPQCLVVQRQLSHLQYPDATKSSTKDLSLPTFKITSSWLKSLSIITNWWNQRKAITSHVTSKVVDSIA